MTNIRFANYDWIIGLEGGRRIHPEHCNVVDTDDCVLLDGSSLILHTRRLDKPITTSYWDGKDYISNYAGGCISSVGSFSYGIYEIMCVLPKGSGQHAAFWLSGFNDWPPEIDCFETYNRLNGSRFSFSDIFRQLKCPAVTREVRTSSLLPVYRVQPNIHYGDKGSNNMFETYNVPVSMLNRPYSSFNTYRILWTMDEIIISFNHTKVFTCKDRDILKQFNHDPYMRVVLSNCYINAIQDGRKDEKNIGKTPFVIKDFMYVPI